MRKASDRDSSRKLRKDEVDAHQIFGEEGTNKTQPKPDPQAKPSDAGESKFIDPTPFNR